MTNAERNRAHALDVLQALSANQPERLRDLMPAEAEWWVLGLGSMKRDPLIDVFRETLGRATVGRLDVYGTTSEGESVAAEGAGHWEFADGRIYKNRYCWFFTFREGALVEVREYLDTTAAQIIMNN